MSQQINGPEVTIQLAEAVTELYTNIKLNSSGLGVLTGGVASEDNRLVGPAQELGSIGDFIRVRCINCVPTSKMVASAAVSAGANVYTMASGRVSSTSTSLTRAGVALEAATAAADVIEIMHLKGGNDDLT